MLLGRLSFGRRKISGLRKKNETTLEAPFICADDDAAVIRSCNSVVLRFFYCCCLSIEMHLHAR